MKQSEPDTFSEEQWNSFASRLNITETSDGFKLVDAKEAASAYLEPTD